MLAFSLVARLMAGDDTLAQLFRLVTLVAGLGAAFLGLRTSTAPEPIDEDE